MAKKSLWQRFVDELKHYKSGFVLLFVDIKVSIAHFKKLESDACYKKVE